MDQRESIEKVLHRVRRGDRAAFDQAAAAFRSRLNALVSLRLGRELRTTIEVDDIVQETLLRAFRSLESLRSTDPGAFFGWLAGIAGHVIVDEARRRDRRPEVPLETSVPGKGASPSRALRRGERLERLQGALDSLDPDHREVILLARIEGLPLDEVGRRMDRTQGAVAQLLWRALRKLRERFGDTESLRLPDQRLQRGGGRPSGEPATGAADGQCDGGGHEG
jgi:RNA polymerase sigma-70 factor (subfamily 1)